MGQAVAGCKDRYIDGNRARLDRARLWMPVGPHFGAAWRRAINRRRAIPPVAARATM